MFKESILMSWQNIIHNKMRSFLTVLGVLIGVASIIALISIVQGVTENITSQVMNLGGNKISVQAMGTPLKRGLTVTDLDRIAKIENIKGVSPSVMSKTSITYNGKIKENTTIQGKNEIFFRYTDDLIEIGRAIYKVDVLNKNKVCLIGKNLKDEFFKTENPIDKEIIINGITYTIIGTLQKSKGFSAGGNDDAVIIPYTTAMSLMATGYISSTDLFMIDSNLSDSTTTDVKATLNTAFNDNEDGFSVSNMQSILENVKTMTGTMTMMLVGIASIALIVGGIGIMNMMLVSVTERTSEIGLRKALGAEPKTIRTQFLLEALFLSLFGGILGLIVGVFIAFMASLAIGTTFVLAGYSVALALGFSALIGIIFGYTPASKASKLNPIDALRSA